MATRVPGRVGVAHRVPAPPPGVSNGPMATGKTQNQSGEGKRGNPKNAAAVLKSKS